MRQQSTRHRQEGTLQDVRTGRSLSGVSQNCAYFMATSVKNSPSCSTFRYSGSVATLNVLDAAGEEGSGTAKPLNATDCCSASGKSRGAPGNADVREGGGGWWRRPGGEAGGARLKTQQTQPTLIRTQLPYLKALKNPDSVLSKTSLVLQKEVEPSDAKFPATQNWRSLCTL